MTPVFDYLNSFSKVSQQSVVELSKISERKSIKAGTQLVKLDATPENVYLLLQGAARSFVYTESGREINESFYLDMSIFASFTALRKQQKSLMGMQALTDCELYSIGYRRLMNLCKKDKAIDRLYQKVLESNYARYEQRYIRCIQSDCKARYLELQKQIPQVDAIVPQYHIASYLGITPVHFCRIKKNLMVNN